MLWSHLKTLGLSCLSSCSSFANPATVDKVVYPHLAWPGRTRITSFGHKILGSGWFHVKTRSTTTKMSQIIFFLPKLSSHVLHKLIDGVDRKTLSLKMNILFVVYLRIYKSSQTPTLARIVRRHVFAAAFVFINNCTLSSLNAAARLVIPLNISPDALSHNYPLIAGSCPLSLFQRQSVGLGVALPQWHTVAPPTCWRRRPFKPDAVQNASLKTGIIIICKKKCQTLSIFNIRFVSHRHSFLQMYK
jgi:hypothetical protein